MFRHGPPSWTISSCSSNTTCSYSSNSNSCSRRQRTWRELPDCRGLRCLRGASSVSSPQHRQLPVSGPTPQLRRWPPRTQNSSPVALAASQTSTCPRSSLGMGPLPRCRCACTTLVSRSSPSRRCRNSPTTRRASNGRVRVVAEWQESPLRNPLLRKLTSQVFGLCCRNCQGNCHHAHAPGPSQLGQAHGGV